MPTGILSQDLVAARLGNWMSGCSLGAAGLLHWTFGDSFGSQSCDVDRPLESDSPAWNVLATT